MKSQKLFVAQFLNQQLVENAIRELKKMGYDIKKMSIIGTDCYTDQKVLGYSNVYDRIGKWGTLGLLAIGLTGFLFGFFFLFNLGASMPYLKMPILYAGAVTLIGTMIALITVGLSKDSTIKYKTRIKSRKFILFADESAAQVNRMRTLLHDSFAKENLITERVNQNLLNETSKRNPTTTTTNEQKNLHDK